MSHAFSVEDSHIGSNDSDSPRYPVRVVARRLGMPTATLRSWSRRYGVGPLQRRPGEHRLYCAADIAVVEVMRDLIRAGGSPGSAARAALNAAVPERTDTESLMSAVFALDVVTTSQMLNGYIGHFGVLDAWEDLIVPVFAEVSARQNDGGRCIDVEHAFSWTVARSLQRRSTVATDGTASVILACTAGESHTLAIEALRAALEEQGRSAVMLGADVPTPALLDAVELRADQRVTVMLSSQHERTADIGTAKAVIGSGAQLAVGGRGWASVKLPRKAKRLANLRDAVEHLTRQP